MINIEKMALLNRPFCVSFQVQRYEFFSKYKQNFVSSKKSCTFALGFNSLIAASACSAVNQVRRVSFCIAFAFGFVCICIALAFDIECICIPAAGTF